MHTAARTVSMLISASSLTRRMIAPIASGGKSTLVTERYLLASSSTCVMAMTMLAPKPAAAKTIPALTTFLCARGEHGNHEARSQGRGGRQPRPRFVGRGYREEQREATSA